MNAFNTMLDKLANFVASPNPDDQARDELLAAIVALRDEGWREAADDDLDRLDVRVRDLEHAADGIELGQLKDTVGSLESRVEDLERGEE